MSIRRPPAGGWRRETLLNIGENRNKAKCFLDESSAEQPAAGGLRLPMNWQSEAGPNLATISLAFQFLCFKLE